MIPCWYEAYTKNPKPPNFFFSQIYPVDFCPAKFPSCSKPATISSACCLQWVFINAFTPGQTGCEMNCDQENSIVYSLRHFEIQRMTAIPVVQDHVLGLLIFFFKVSEWYSSEVGEHLSPTAFSFWISDAFPHLYSSSISYLQHLAFQG